MQFKKETTLSSSFQSRLKFETSMGMPDFLKAKQCYAVVEGQKIIKRFKIALRSGTYHAIPYASLPIMIFDHGKLIIKAYGMHIELFGRGTCIIEQYISEERLLFVKESQSGVDIDNEDVFIESIKVLGKNVSLEIAEDEI